MRDLKKTCRVALVQAEPVMFDKAGGVKKTLRCIRNAAVEKAELIVFPELFIPGYPIGMNFGFSMGKRTEAGRADWMRYYNASLLVDGEEFRPLPETDTDGADIWCVYRNNIPAKNLHQLHSFRLTEGSNSVEMKYGVLSWANSKLGGFDENDRNLAAAMYLYNYAARKYFQYDAEGLQ